MISIFDGLRKIDLLTVIFRMFTAFLCGLSIGMERSYKNRPAGFRTHILVCIGAATASMTGIYLYLNAHISTDISRIGAQVVSGLGFIGGGTIIVVNKKKIKGLTTAAGLWACGIIGLAIGAGFYEGAFISAALILITEIGFSQLTDRIKQRAEFQILLHYHNKVSLNHVMRYCKDNKLSISNLQVTGVNEDEAAVYSAIITIRPRRDIDHEKLLKHIRVTVGIISADEI